MKAEALLERVRQGYAPPPRLTVSAFADRELIVTTGPLAGTRWRTDFAPYQRGILDVFHEPAVQIAVVMGSSQWGKTACATAITAFHMAHDPSTILVVEPTVDPLAKDFARNRLEPLVEASPALRERVSKRRSRDAQNSTLAKTFRGGDIAIGGANSAASLAARSRRLLILDELDRYPAELPGEGSTIEIALKRTQSYKHRRRILMLSSPTLRGAPIDTWFQRGDRRYFFVPCPACSHMHRLLWANIRRVEDDRATDFRGDGRDADLARFVCPACGMPFGDAERIEILARGEWRAECPDREDRSIVSFHVWEGYSPLSSLREIVTSFLRARRAQREGDRSLMHTWINTTLGEPVEPDDGEGVEPHALLLRRESYGDVAVPFGACVLTAGVDVQDDRLEYLVIGWGPGEESWLVDRGEIPGDTSHPEPWRNLNELLDAQYRHPAVDLPISAMAIDSAGHRTNEVYEYVYRNAARRVFAIIGRDGQKPLVSSPSPRGWGRTARKVRLFTVGVDTAKALLMSRLALTEKGPGFVHLPHAEWADEELAAQLTSERLVTRFVKGIPETSWRKMRARNEMLDAAIYALAALRLVPPRLEQWADELRERMEMSEQPATAPTPPRPRMSWLGPRRQGWLR